MGMTVVCMWVYDVTLLGAPVTCVRIIIILVYLIDDTVRAPIADGDNGGDGAAGCGAQRMRARRAAPSVWPVAVARLFDESTWQPVRAVCSGARRARACVVAYMYEVCVCGCGAV
eukprot:scaffold869_cov105-Isochrysis_galbana.AAC.44